MKNYLFFMTIKALILSPDNSCGGSTGYTCGAYSCCSQYGWCGTTSDYCSTGCQSAFGGCGTLPTTTVAPPPPEPTTTFPVSPDNSCGLNAGYSCFNSCCSQYGWCGSSTDHCGTGCQRGFGQCGTIVLQEPPEPTILNVPITKRGDCGPESKLRCPLTGNVCCSDNGICGKTVKECSIVGWACRPEYGKCGGPQAVPALNSYPSLNSTLKTSMVTQCTRPGVFALTFDDGVFDYTDKLLDLLKTNDVKATFFINAYNVGDITVNSYKAALLKMFTNGHHIASHTYDHLDLARLGYNGIWAQMQRNDEAIKSVIGVKPIYMRPPYGSVNDPVLTALGSWGYKVVWQNIDSEDVFHLDKVNAIDLDTQSYETTGKLSSSSPLVNSFISLQHDPIKETAEQWAQKAINLVKAKGYNLVTVGDCLGQPLSSQWYRN
jgi:peptidoglycan/xylan/chitin deacetylase (PgdA/CDA1 family)